MITIERLGTIYLYYFFRDGNPSAIEEDTEKITVVAVTSSDAWRGMEIVSSLGLNWKSKLVFKPEKLLSCDRLRIKVQYCLITLRQSLDENNRYSDLCGSQSSIRLYKILLTASYVIFRK